VLWPLRASSTRKLSSLLITAVHPALNKTSKTSLPANCRSKFCHASPQNHDDDAMNWSPTTEKRSASVSWRRILVDCSTQSCGQTQSWSPTGSSRRRERKINLGQWTRERMLQHQSTDRQQQLCPRRHCSISLHRTAGRAQ